MTKAIGKLHSWAMSLAVLGGLSGGAAAQAGPGSGLIPSVTLDSVDVREGLRTLLHTPGVSYVIAPEVHGTVTLHLKNVKLEKALREITRQVHATYRLEDGVWEIADSRGPRMRSSKRAIADPSQLVIPSLTYEQAEVRSALGTLLRTMGVNYTIAPNVQGIVTVDLSGVTFEVALQSITRQVDARYRVEEGTWQITKHDAPISPESNPTTIPSISIHSADVRMVLRSLLRRSGISYTIDPAVQGTVTVELKNLPLEIAVQTIARQVDATLNVEHGVFKIVKRQDPAGQTVLPSLSFDRADGRDALASVFKKSGLSYTIWPEVMGTVTLDLKNVTVETAVQVITHQMDATYRVEGGVWTVRKRGEGLEKDPAQLLVESVKCDSADAREILRSVLQKAGVSFSIDPDVQGTVTVDLKNVTLENAIQAISRQVNATYRLEGGIWKISRRQPL